MTAGLTLDTGALIAVERGDRRVTLLLEDTVRQGSAVHVPAGVVAQAWRGGSRQSLLARVVFSRQVAVIDLDLETARAVGTLCGISGQSDIVATHVAWHAARQGHRVVTSDPDDIARIDPTLDLIVV